MAKNFIDDGQKYKLFQWIEQNREFCENHNNPDIVAQVKKDIGIHLNPYQIVRPLKAVGVVKIKKTMKVPKLAQVDLFGSMETLRNTNIVLAGALWQLLSKLAHDLDDNYLDEDTAKELAEICRGEGSARARAS